jgi:hypothetical protein
MLLSGACGSPDPLPALAGVSDYFPLAKGKYFIYDVTEIRYTLNVAETREYELKVMVADSFLNQADHYTYVLHRSFRPGPSALWTPLETWSARLPGNELVITEGNIPYVVLKFPVISGMIWDGNTYNTLVNPSTQLPQDEYEITRVGEILRVGDAEYADCVTILQEDNQEYTVFNDVRKEVYAKDIGLISKTVTQVTYCNETGRNCFGQQIIDEGIIYTQSLKEYGKE